MTSGHFSSVPISKVWINRSERQRRELKDIPALADSIQRLGLIHPPVVTRDFELKAGERRIEACKSLGWTSVPVQFVDELDPTLLLLLELEENIKRVDITWQENCAAVAKYHSIRCATDPEWAVEKTADAVGETAASVRDKLQVMRESVGNKFISEAPKYSTARNISRRVIERRRDAALQEIAPRPPKSVPLLCADFLTWKSDINFNFIHCDFPYGINFQDHGRQDSVKFSEAYDDTFAVYEALLDALERAPVADSAHLMFWFSMQHYVWTLDRLGRMGWKVDPFPLVWSKGSAGILPDPQRGPRRVYETAFMASRGDRKVVQSTSNHVAFWSDERAHQSEKPKEVLRHFFRMFVDEYSIMLDPTCGSANAVKVSDEMGAKLVLGLEKNEEFYEEARRNYFKSTEE